MLVSSTAATASYRSTRLSFTESLNKHASDKFIARSADAVAEGLSFRRALEAVRPETDRVVSAARVNEASDALLLNFVDKLPLDLAKMTWAAVTRLFRHGDTTPEAMRESTADYKIGSQPPLEMKPLLATLKSVMQESPDLTPHIGPEHVWSEEGKSYQGLGFLARVGQAVVVERPFPFPTFARSKLICALGLGATNVVMPTGTEARLKAWVLSQDSGTIEFHELFGQAYRLNKGDLYATLLSAENVLCEGLYDPNRQSREVTKRLSYLRSDSAPAGDNFGSWYHLVGSALYSLMRPEWKAGMVMKIEGMGSDILEGKDPQEDHINSLGVELGAGLRAIAEDGLPQDEVKPEPYVNLREFAWDRRSLARFTVPSPKTHGLSA